MVSALVERMFNPVPQRTSVECFFFFFRAALLRNKSIPGCWRSEAQCRAREFVSALGIVVGVNKWADCGTPGRNSGILRP